MIWLMARWLRRYWGSNNDSKKSDEIQAISRELATYFSLEINPVFFFYK